MDKHGTNPYMANAQRSYYGFKNTLARRKSVTESTSLVGKHMDGFDYTCEKD